MTGSDSLANVVLTFRDGDGLVWVAAAYVGPIRRSREDGEPDEVMEIQDLRDRAFTLYGIKVIDA